jgi:hypothetical protein
LRSLSLAFITIHICQVIEESAAQRYFRSAPGLLMRWPWMREARPMSAAILLAGLAP